MLLNMSNMADGQACKFFVFPFDFIEGWAIQLMTSQILDGVICILMEGDAHIVIIAMSVWMKLTSHIFTAKAMLHRVDGCCYQSYLVDELRWYYRHLDEKRCTYRHNSDECLGEIDISYIHGEGDVAPYR